MFCRRVWQRVGPLAQRLFSPTSRNTAPVRHMAFGVPGGSTNLTYFVLCGGGLTAAVVYVYKTVSGDTERYEDRLANMNSQAKVKEAPEAAAPAAEPAAAAEEPAPEAEIITESVPAEPVTEISAEPVDEAASEEAAVEASETVVTEAPAEPEEEAAPAVVEESAPEAAPAVVEESAPEAAPAVVEESAPEAASEVTAEAAAAESPGTAAVDEILPVPPPDAETPSGAVEAEAAAAEVAA